MMDDKRYVQEEKRKLEEYGAYLVQEKNNIEDQKMVLEKREKKLAEVADLIPSANALKDIGMGFEQAIVFIDCIKEKAQKEMIDEKTAAWKLAQELRQWQEFGGLEKAISTATNQLLLLNTTLEQQKQAIVTLVHLQKIGITEAEIGQLIKLVGGWSGVSKNNGGNMTTNSSSEFVGGKKLDDKLIGVGN
jgi:hypothetical protein